MKRLAVLAVLALITLAPASPRAQEPRLPSSALLQALVEEVSGEIAFRYTARISQFDRVQASDGWHEAAAWIKGELDAMGYKDAVIEGWPSNGSTRYFTYKTPIGWSAKSAELWMVSPRRERLCSLEEMPLTLIKHSGRAHVEAEVIDVGTGTDERAYRGKDVKGKIVLATGAPGQVAREAVMARGAVGMIGWYSPDTRPGHPNLVRYTAFWPAWEDRDKVGFGFNVSKNQGWILKQLLEDGRKVVVKADVDSEFHETKVETLSVSLPGAQEPEKELLIVGHLCHPTPSANDNASGAGGMLEMARALKRLLDRGTIPPPRRTIRFLWVPEFAGTVPYIKAHLDRTRQTLAVINCDMIGENLAKTGGAFTITQTPGSLPTYLNDVAVHFAALVDALNLRSINGSENPFAWRAAPYSGGSDHLVFNDGSLRVPALMFGHGDTFHHTSLDSLDKVDASELRRVSVIALGTMVYLASAGDAEARDMALLVTRNGMGRLAANHHDRLPALLAVDTAAKLQAAQRDLANAVRHGAWREREAILSTLAFGAAPETTARVKAFAGSIDALAANLAADALRFHAEAARRVGASAAVQPAAAGESAITHLVPVRSPEFVCPLDGGYLDEKVGPKALAGVSLRGDAAYEALNFVNGRRSVAEIANAVSAELEPVTAAEVLAYFRVLEKAGLVTLTQATTGTATRPGR